MTDSLPHSVELALRARAQNRALNERVNGIWRSVSSLDFLTRVQNAAAGLASLGIKPGHTLGIISASTVDWLAIDIGALSIGAVTVPMFANLSDENLEFQLEDSDIRYLYVAGEAAFQKIQAHAYRFACIITDKVAPHQAENQITLAEVMEHGARLSVDQPHILPRRLESIDPDQLATIIYTSGSAGRPKGVELTHRNLLQQIKSAKRCFPLSTEEDKAVSCLPLAHVFERMVVYFYLCSSVEIYFVDDLMNLAYYLQDVRPTTITMVPRLLEKLYGRIRERSESSPFLQRQIARWAIRRACERSPDSPRSFADKIADRVVYSKLRKKLGGRLKRIISGGAALSPSLQSFYMNVGLPIYVGYGLTEAAPVLAANYEGHNKVGTVGHVFPGVQVRIDEQGEVLARGPNIMRGYHGRRDATQSAIDPEGWLHTGDLGHFDEQGYLVIDGRLKDLLKTSNGKYVCPVPMEQELAASRFVDMAMIVAEGKPFVSALLFIDVAKLDLARQRHPNQRLSDEDVLEDPFFKERIEARIEKINRHANEWEKIRAYRCVLRPPSIEAQELTPTMKLRRHIVEENHRELIDEMYSKSSVTTQANRA